MSHSYQTESRLQPEYIRALNQLELVIDFLKPSPLSTLNEGIWRKGSVAMFYGPFAAKNIPSGRHWRWNQTRSRKKVMSWRNANVEIIKLIPRKRNTRVRKEDVPLFKMWLFEISSPQCIAFVLWCEKGLSTNPEPVITPITIDHETNQNTCNISPPQEEIKIQDLTFLSKFMAKETALSFWPDMKFEDEENSKISTYETEPKELLLKPRLNLYTEPGAPGLSFPHKNQ